MICCSNMSEWVGMLDGYIYFVLAAAAEARLAKLSIHMI